jgi:hypothetical protein
LLIRTGQNSDFTLFPIFDPKARLRFEILFRKTHPRIDLITLFFPKIYLLISEHDKTIFEPLKLFLDKISKPFTKGGTLRNLNFKVLSI